MALHTFELNDACGVTCNACLGKKGFLALDSSVSSSDPGLKDGSQLDDSCSHENVTGVLNDGIPDPEKVAPEQEMEKSQQTNSSISFLFEKRLTPSDCDAKAGRILLPNQHAEKLVTLPPGQRKKAIVVKDTNGAIWNLKLRWWPNRRSRKYVLDGTRKMQQNMQWHAGDRLRFYRQASDKMLIMELHRVPENTSSSVPLAGDAANSPGN